MPRVTWNKPPAQKALEEELRARYGGSMSFTDVQHELGFKHETPTKKWLTDVPYTIINNHKCWRVGFVAEKLHNNTHMEVAK